MEIVYGVLILLVVLGVVVTILAYIGLKTKEQEKKWIDEYNNDAINVFKLAKKKQKQKRQSTPRVPTIKK